MSDTPRTDQRQASTAPGGFARAWVCISGKIMIVRGKLSFDGVWTCAACLVLLAQVNLLWVAALHRHEEEAVPARTTATSSGEPHSQPGLERSLLCTPCQIVRNGAARPTLGTPAPSSATSASIAFTVDPGEFAFYRPSVTYGRAPPPA